MPDYIVNMKVDSLKPNPINKEIYDDNKSSTKVTGKIKRVGDKSFELESDSKTLSLSYDQVKSALVKVSFK